jgi:hypothetical protein
MHTFKFSSKLRIFETQAIMTFSMAEKGNYNGMLEFLENGGVSLDGIVRNFWKKVAGQKTYPFPKLNARFKSINVQMMDTVEGGLFLIQAVVGQIEVSIYFNKNKDAGSTQIISIASIRPIVIDRLPGVDVPLEEPIIVNFTFNLASRDTTVNLGEGEEKAFTKGFSYDFDLKLPQTEQETFTFTIPTKEEAYAEPVNTKNVSVPTKEETGEVGIPSVFWYELNRKIGPATFHKIGLTLEGEKIWVLLNTDFSFANLTLALKGLRIGSDLDKLGTNVRVGLDGLGVAYQSPFFSVVGLLVNEKDSDQYIGSITIKSKFLSIFGAGAYGKIDGNNSVFVYALVDYPIGGVPFFFVQGLALGFGYNRLVNIPSIEKLSEFPLVQQAVGNRPAIKQGELLESLANNLGEAFPLSQGNLFFAVGVKFTSFKLLDAFLLLVVGFGERLKFDVVGIGALSLPPMLDKPQVYIELVMRTAFLPEEGAIKIRGSVSPNSFILSDNARLSGGFAFYAWFKDSENLSTRAGDFVLTLGGYHPRFNKPEHYPDVPRVDLTWHVTENFFIKGQSYLALTPGAIMLGGSFKAVYIASNFKASFDFEMDLLAQWKPFYYDFTTTINAQIEFKASILRVHKTISMDVGADLEIFGPDFSGKANINIKTFGINFNFGIDFGSKQEFAKNIDWQSFKEGFLPEEGQVLSIQVVDGLNEQSDDFITVNPKDFKLQIESIIPATKTDVDEDEVGQSFGIYPMGLTELTSEISVEISDEAAEFELYEMVKKNVPSALWSSRGVLELNDPSMVTDALSGFVIQAAAPAHEAEITLNTSALSNTVFELEKAWSWENPMLETNTSFDFDAITSNYTGAFHLLSLKQDAITTLRSKIMVVNEL